MREGYSRSFEIAKLKLWCSQLLRLAPACAYEPGPLSARHPLSGGGRARDVASAPC